MAQPLTGHTELAAQHNKYMEEKAQFLLSQIEEALQILETRFGMKYPFPSKEPLKTV